MCGILWYPTRYHELLMYLVAEQVIATGAYTTDREYFATKSEGPFDAPCLGLRTGLSYSGFLQLKIFFCLRRVTKDDVTTDPTDPRFKKTMSKTHALDEFMDTLRKSFPDLAVPETALPLMSS